MQEKDFMTFVRENAESRYSTPKLKEKKFYQKHGGLRFFALGRLRLSFCVAKKVK